MSLFLLGAGFNGDAMREAGPIYGNSIYVGRYPVECGYPLLADTPTVCFGLHEAPNGKSVEDLFSDAIQRGDSKPLERLAERLMEADYRLACKLASSNTSNCYRQFFQRFSEAHFLTFNYDSLPEIFLSQARCWYPEDGYGVLVATERQPERNVPARGASASIVLHLHGSLCVYTSEFQIEGNPFQGAAELVHRERPLYAFDPDSITSCFRGYRRMISPTGRVRIEDRVIAPVPDKAEGLKQVFIRETYQKACSLARQSGTLVAIGYSFNPHDAGSYDRILRSLAKSRQRELIVVSPDAAVIASRIRHEYPALRVIPTAKTLNRWAADSFGH